jgi:large subunit ribosomal protein L28
MKSFSMKYPRVAHMGNNVSHAKNRTRRSFKYNLHSVTVVVDGVKQKLRVPTKVLRSLKKAGVTTHYKKED